MNDENLDLLDLDDADTPVDDNLPDATPFAAPRPHRPWLLLVIGYAMRMAHKYMQKQLLPNM